MLITVDKVIAPIYDKKEQNERAINIQCAGLEKDKPTIY